MKKQIILFGAVVLVTVSAWALLTISPVKKSAATPKCSKTCQQKPAPNSAPQTGFFIFDSFSGTL
ncbi:MAG: hypothetical protein KA160_05575 [Lacibacter sp.]|nr:hypothetical protein [Lacibacter sp.]